MTTVCGSPGYVGKDSGTEMLYQMAALTVYWLYMCSSWGFAS
jgi:hypothetical protein